MTITFQSADTCACHYDLAEFVVGCASNVVAIVDVNEQEVRDLVMQAIERKRLTMRDVAFAITTSESGVVVTVYYAVAAAILTVEQLKPGVLNSWARKRELSAPFYFVRHPSFTGLKNAFLPPCFS